MIAFVVPVSGRHRLGRICLTHLRHVCAEIGDCTAVLAGNEPYFKHLAADLGFHWVYATNDPLGRKWNDAYMAAAVKNADYFIPVGSDDVVHPSLFEQLPDGDQIFCTRHSAIVNPDGNRLVSLSIDYPGGDGVRIFTRHLLEQVMFRPCMDDRHRAIDGSITQHLQRTGREPEFVYRNTDPLAIVDFKSNTSDQRNSFLSCLTFAIAERSDVVDAVAEVHGDELAAKIAGFYREEREGVAA